jgi:hypothetical protein
LAVTPGAGGCPDPFASSTTVERDVTVTPEVTQASNSESDFWCTPSAPVAGSRLYQGDEALQFDVEGSCPDRDPAQASVSVDVTNKSEQTVYFAKGIDAVVHVDGRGTRQDVHLTDPSATSLAPGQHVHLTKHVDVEPVGSYWVSGTITYGFVPPAA